MTSARATSDCQLKRQLQLVPTQSRNRQLPGSSKKKIYIYIIVQNKEGLAETATAN